MAKREYQTVQIPTAEHDKHDSNFVSGDEAWVFSFNPGRQTQNDKLGSSPIVPQKNHKHKEGFFFFFSSHSRTFHSYEDDIITDEVLKFFTYARHSWALNTEFLGFLSVSHLL